MDGVLLVLIILVVAAIGLAVWALVAAFGQPSARPRWPTPRPTPADVIERLGGQVINLTGTDDASKQALADASERYTAAGSQIDQATTAKQALLAKESAMEGLYYVRAARIAMGMDPGPELESLAGQQSAGTVTEDRRVELRRPRDRGVADPVGAHPELLPRRPRRRPSGSRRLVLRAVVEARAGRRRMGRGLGVPVQRVVLGHGRSGLRRPGFREGYGEGYQDGLDAGGDGGGDAGGDYGGDGGGWDGGGGGGGDGGGWGGDFGGGDFGGFDARRLRSSRLGEFSAT